MTRSHHEPVLWLKGQGSTHQLGIYTYRSLYINTDLCLHVVEVSLDTPLVGQVGAESHHAVLIVRLSHTSTFSVTGKAFQRTEVRPHPSLPCQDKQAAIQSFVIGIIICNGSFIMK